MISGQSTFAQNEIAEGFFDEVVSENYTLPIGIRFDEDGNGYVWEKAGKVYLLSPPEYDKTLILDISEEVASWGDHGFTGFVLDPNYNSNGYVYTAYTVDRHHLLNFGTVNYDQDSTIIKNATIGRLTRFTFSFGDNGPSLVPNSRKVLIGEDRFDGFPILADFHGVGSLAFGNDGSLIIGCGDGGLDNEPGTTYHTEQALEDGIIDSTMVLGSYRAQTIHSMNGKLMRVNPETGDGYPSNPFFDAENPRSPQSRTWALGLRNPYKFIHIPETGEHGTEAGEPGYFVIGDVGSSYWEEFNLSSQGGQNFGWPLFEGHHPVWPYGFYEIENPFAPNPLANGASCRKNFLFSHLLVRDNAQREYKFYNPCSEGTLEIPSNILTYSHTRPFLYYNNSQWNPPARAYIPGYDSEGLAAEIPVDSSEFNISALFDGYSAIPGTWYKEGSFPEEFNNSLLAIDFEGWIKAITFDSEWKVTKVKDFRSEVKGIVDLTLNPLDDCVYYINIINMEVRKICFGGNPAPVAVAIADTLYGGSELSVNFDASQSFDPNQLQLAYEWDFGDGNSSEEKTVQHTFTVLDGNPKTYTVKLLVTDSLEASSIDSIKISLNNSPPLVQITSPQNNSKYAINGYNRLDLKAAVADAEEANESLKYNWQVHLHHNDHFHSEEPNNTPSYSTLLEPLGCKEKDVFWYRINLEVEDSYGLKANDEVLIYPNCNQNGEIRWNRHEYGSDFIDLYWENDNISDVDRFVIQRIDETGNVIDLGEVEENFTTYSFRDESPIDGVNRYRLKIFLLDGTYFYSTERTASFPVSDPIQIYPNPSVNEGFTIEVDQPFGEAVKIEVFDLKGARQSIEIIENTPANNFKLFIPTVDLAEGIYLIKVINGERVFTRKVEVLK